MTTGHREVVGQAAPASAIRERNRDHRFFTGMALAADLTAVEDRKALRLLDGELVELLVPSEVLWTLERARVAGRAGDGRPRLPVRGERLAARRCPASAVRGRGQGGAEARVGGAPRARHNRVAPALRPFEMALEALFRPI
jgi:hypothetical protein